MLFSSPLFLFFVLPPALLLYFLAPKVLKNAVLLVASVLFYAWGEPAAVLVVLASAVLDYLLGPKVVKPGPEGGRWLALGVSANLLLLFVYKYADFFIGTVEPVLGPLPHLNLALPLGVSFIVFEKITYLVDLRRGESRTARTFRDYLLFVFFFPKVLAGPIIKYHEIDDALRNRQADWDDRTWGFLRFLWGLARKVLIADVCAQVVDRAFDPAGATPGFTGAWIGVIAFTAQIYFDFAGYSDMALGLARMFGFKLRENFAHPYGAVSFTEFWKRWHISLTTWIRSYLYIPLGGNRHGQARTYLNLWLCFLLSGLWHGAAWTFVLWGAWHGAFMVLDRQSWWKWTEKLPSPLRAAGVLVLVAIGWTIFRAHDLPQLGAMLAAMASPGLDGRFVALRSHELAAIVIGLGGALIAATPLVRRVVEVGASRPAVRAGAAVFIVALGGLAIAKALTTTFNPFLYFRF
ncbi:MBOAT family protein [Caulobacter sp.]|uniref:MBOAT family protein n=1 Tax=Caulobacter sp. TaxID=78 RepID=UPI001607D554